MCSVSCHKKKKGRPVTPPRQHHPTTPPSHFALRLAVLLLLSRLGHLLRLKMADHLHDPHLGHGQQHLQLELHHRLTQTAHCPHFLLLVASDIPVPLCICHPVDDEP